MILIDTNVISELWKPAPNERVVAWLDAQMIETLHVSVVTIAELRFGIGVMPEGRRRAVLEERLDREVTPLFAGRILPFDLSAAHAYGALMAAARAEGRAIATADGQIAATAAAYGLTVATRDVSPFRAARLKVINPWDEG